MTRDEVCAIVKKHIVPRMRGYRWKVAGSFRRRLLNSEDIDIVIVGDGHVWMDQNPDLQYREGGSKRVRFWIGDILVDLGFCESECFETMLLMYTGSGKFNRSMRWLAKEYGYKLNEYGLFNRITGILITRKVFEIFQLLKLEWHEPYQRRGWIRT